MKDKIVIALVGKKGSGKSTVKNILDDIYISDSLKFADPLKNMFRQLLADLGIYSDIIERCVEGDLKETSMEELLGKTPRHLMQTLGTEWGRDCVHKDFWVDALKLRVENSKQQLVIVDDCRFVNEAKAIRDLGGKIVRIHRGSVDSSDTHPSEKEMDFIEADITIYNNSSMEYLEEEVKELIGSYIEEKIK